MRRVLWNAGLSVQATTSPSHALDLAAQVRAHHPALRTLIVSGDRVAAAAIEVPRAMAIAKPFPNQVLVERVRDLLNSYP